MNTRRVWLLVFCVLSISSTGIQAQSFDFDGNWDSQFYINGLDGDGYCSLLFQGQVIVGGAFTHAGAIRAHGIAGWNPVIRHFFALGEGLEGRVTGLAVYQGNLVALHIYTDSSGNSVKDIARWDGENWSPLGVGFPQYSWAIIEFQGTLYTERYRLVDGQWEDFAQTAGVHAMVVHDGRLILGGSFSQLHGVAAEGAASWDGVSVEPMASGLNPDVETLHVAGGDLYATSHVPNYVNGVYYDLVQRWNGNTWQTLNFPIEDVYGGVDWVTMGVFNDQLVVMIRLCGDYGCSVIAGIRDGWTWEDFPLFPGDGLITVNSMQESEGRLLLIGSMVGTSSFPSRNIIEVNGTGAFPLVHDGQGLSGSSQSVCTFQGDLVVGGNFDSAGSIRASAAARWDGNHWQSMSEACNSNGYEHPVSYYDGFDNLTTDGETLIGNYMHWYNYNQHPTLSIWDPVESLWDYSLEGMEGVAIWNGEIFGFADSGVHVLQDGAWESIGSCDGSVWNMEALPDGLVVAGFFAEMEGVAAGGLARWDGASWSAIGTALPGPGRAVCQFQGQTTVAYGNGYGSFVAAWNGTDWVSMGGMLLGNINYLEPYGDQLYAGGSVNFYDDESRGNLAYWDGQSWSMYGNGLNGEVKGMEVLDGKLFLVGDFTEAGNIASSGVACLLAPLPSPASVETENGVPGSLELERAFPNPFNPTIDIVFSQSRAGFTTLDVHDIRGNLVRNLLNDYLEAGSHALVWNGRDDQGRAMPSGVYFVRVAMGSDIRTRKIILAK